MASIDSVFESVGFDGTKKRKVDDKEEKLKDAEQEEKEEASEKEPKTVTQQEAIQELVDNHEDGFSDRDWIKTLALDFERAISSNTEKRELFAKEPLKFMESEEQLEKSIRALSALATTEDYEFQRTYERFVSEFECHVSLMQLLDHPNLDIALITCDIFQELLMRSIEFVDGDALNRALWQSSDFCDYLTQLADKIVDVDPAQITHIIDLADAMYLQDTNNHQLMQVIFPKFLDLSVAQKSALRLHDRSTMADFCQSCLTNYYYRKQVSESQVEALISHLMGYLDKEPTKGDEEGLAGAVAGSLEYVLKCPSGRADFAAVEGMDAMVKLLGGLGKWVKKRAASIIRAALNSYDATKLAIVFVQARGLGVLFKALKSGKNKHYTVYSGYSESLWSIYASLLRLLPSESPERIRTVAKLDPSKLKQLKELRDDIQQQVETLEPMLEDALENDESEEEIFADMEMLGSKLVVVLDTIFAWLKAEGVKVETTVDVLKKERAARIEFFDDGDTYCAEGEEEEEEILDMLQNTGDVIRMYDYLLSKAEGVVDGV